MSAGKCNQLCTSRQFKFFGLQAGNECWCGNSYGKYEAKGERECSNRCNGHITETCGGGWRNSVFTTDYVSGLHYIGCFADNGNRDLTTFGGSGGMSIYKCFQICPSRKFAYFGVQFADECYCGNSFGRYRARPNSECNMHCRRDKNSLCGAGWRNNVYATGLRPHKPGLSPSGLQIRDSMAAKIRSMSASMPAGVVCSTCLITSFQRSRIGHNSEDFPVSELNSRMARSFEDSTININPNHATKSTYFGIAERVGSRVHLGMVSADIVATLVHKYSVYTRKACKRIIFWNRCHDQVIKERRGYHGEEIRQIDTALQSETMKVFLENLGYINV